MSESNKYIYIYRKTSIRITYTLVSKKNSIWIIESHYVNLKESTFLNINISTAFYCIILCDYDSDYIVIIKYMLKNYSMAIILE